MWGDGAEKTTNKLFLIVENQHLVRQENNEETGIKQNLKWNSHLKKKFATTYAKNIPFNKYKFGSVFRI